MLLPSKTALITGAGRGIGRATAELFAAHGASLVLTARTETELREVESHIKSHGAPGRTLVVPGPLTDETFVTDLFRQVQDEFGRLDILINNAGTASFGPIEDLPVSALRANLELNVIAVYACTQAAIRLMKTTGDSGKIITIGSVRSHWTEGGDAGVYNASKFAVRGLTESIARQLHGSGSNIAVGLVCPGIVDTPLTNPTGEPRPEWMRPADVAAAILHAATAPPGVNVFDTVVFPTSQKPW